MSKFAWKTISTFECRSDQFLACFDRASFAEQILSTINEARFANKIVSTFDGVMLSTFCG